MGLVSKALCSCVLGGCARFADLESSFRKTSLGLCWIQFYIFVIIKPQ